MGFAVLRAPSINHSNAEEFDVRKDAVLWSTRDALGCRDLVGSKWRMQYLRWPETDAGAVGEGVDKGAVENAGIATGVPADSETEVSAFDLGGRRHRAKRLPPGHILQHCLRPLQKHGQLGRNVDLGH